MNAPETAIPVEDLVGESGHHLFSPSSFSRRELCRASAQAEHGRPNPTSPYAAEGTAGHWVAEVCLETGRDAVDMVGVCCENGVEITEELAAAAQVYVDHVRDRSQGATLLVERRVDLSDYLPGWGGTADAIVLREEEGVAELVDLKLGQGVQVHAEENRQLMLYAAGAVLDYAWHFEVKRVRMVIVQPRLDHIDEWEADASEVLGYLERARGIVAEALAPEPPFSPSVDACRFCLASADCKARARHAFEVAAAEFTDVGDPIAFRDANAIDDEAFARILDRCDELESFTKAIRSRAFETLDRGGHVPGWKLVEGRSLRRWRDEADAGAVLEERLGADAWERKLISPAQVEKRLGKRKAVRELLEPLTEKPPGRPTLAPESDKRPALPGQAERDFSDDPDE